MPTLFQINVVRNLLSTGHFTEEIGKLAIEKGWESFIAHGRYNVECESKIIKIGSNLSVLNHGFQTRIFDRHGLGSRHATRKLINKIQEIKPDIIHLHNLHGYYINIEELFNYLSKSSIPVIWSLYDCWPITGHCVYFTLVDCDKWETKCHTSTLR